MRNLLYTENLKMKRTMGKRLVAIAPLVNMVLSVFAGYFLQCGNELVVCFYF